MYILRNVFAMIGTVLVFATAHISVPAHSKVNAKATTQAEGSLDKTETNIDIQFTTAEWIALAQTIVLVATIWVMWSTSRRQLSEMRIELKELRRNLRNVSHHELFSRIFSVYDLYIRYPNDLSAIWDEEKRDSSQIRQAYAAYAIIDLLYLMHVERDTLDPGLMDTTWKNWARSLSQNEQLYAVYDGVKSEYPLDFRKAVEAAAKSG